MGDIVPRFGVEDRQSCLSSVSGQAGLPVLHSVPHIIRPLMRKKVYIAYTGGTIGMQRTRSGYRPQTGSLQKQLAGMPELRHPSMPAYTIHEYAPLLDSSNMT